MNKIIASAVAAVAALGAVSANATVLLAGSSFQPTQSFALISGTQGTMLDSVSYTGTAFTFSATVRSAVYRNTAGTLDFYYQVARTGAGSLRNQEIEELTASDFTGFTVNAFASSGDVDGGGFFTALNNAGAPTTSFGRSKDGAVIEVGFGSNGLVGTETSATYVFRTNALKYDVGTFGVIDGSTLSGLAFQPAPAVPEPATWTLLIAGFAMTGYAARRRNNVVAA